MSRRKATLTDEEIKTITLLAQENDFEANTRPIIQGGSGIKCGNCGKKNPANAKYCSRCKKCIDCPAQD